MMKIRMGFITNSSSTNFLIISKRELTSELLFEKLGFIEGGKLAEKGHELCAEIIGGIRDLHSYDYVEPTYENIKTKFGPNAAKWFEKMKGAYIYCGSTSSDQTPIAQFFTTDSFEIEQDDFYLNGRNCVW